MGGVTPDTYPFTAEYAVLVVYLSFDDRGRTKEMKDSPANRFGRLLETACSFRMTISTACLQYCLVLHQTPPSEEQLSLCDWQLMEQESFAGGVTSSTSAIVQEDQQKYSMVRRWEGNSS